MSRLDAVAERYGKVGLLPRGYALTAVVDGTPRIEAEAAGPPLLQVYCAAKPILALLLARLAERGAVDPLAPIGRALPFRDPAKRDITPLHVVTHTSGLDDPADLVLFGDNHDEAFRVVDGTPLVDRPGRSLHYSAFSGVFVLAAYLEAVTATPLPGLLRDLAEEAGLGGTVLPGLTPEAYAAVAPRIMPVAVLAPGEPGAPATFVPAPELSSAECLVVPYYTGGAFARGADLAAWYGVYLDQDTPLGRTAAASLARVQLSGRDSATGAYRVFTWGVERRLHATNVGCHVSDEAVGASGGWGAATGIADPAHRLALSLVFPDVIPGKLGLQRRMAFVDAAYEDLGLTRADVRQVRVELGPRTTFVFGTGQGAP